MYTHISKGATIGAMLGRRLSRGITSIPGIFFDHIVACFYVSKNGQYREYWDENVIAYADDTKVGYLEGITGWVGDIAGIVIGGTVGTLIGAVTYVPHSILTAICFLHDEIHKKLSETAQVIGNRPAFNEFISFSQPDNYMQKAWNISSIALGAVIAAPFYAVARVAEFLIPPMGNGLSSAILTIGSFLGGTIGYLAAAAFWPAKYICNKTVELYRKFADKVETGAAIVYAQTKQEPADGDQCLDNNASCITGPNIHSNSFREKVATYKKMSTADIFLGGVGSAQSAPVTTQPQPRAVAVPIPSAPIYYGTVNSGPASAVTATPLVATAKP